MPRVININPENTDYPLGKKDGPVWYVMIIYPAVVQWEEPSINQATSGERSTMYAIVKSHDINDRTDSLMGFFNRIPMGLKLHKMVFHLGISQDKGVP